MRFKVLSACKSDKINRIMGERCRTKNEEGYKLPNHRKRSELDAGEAYITYRAALYADRFRQHNSLSDTRSVCVFYMLHLGLSINQKRSLSFTRI